MAKRKTTSTIPVQLRAAVRAHRRGLRTVAIEQFAQRNYEGIDTEIEPDDEDEEAERIASEVYAAAQDARGDGDRRFRAVLFTEVDGDVERHEVKFMVGDEPIDSASPEAQARASMLDEMRRYIGELHNIGITREKSIGAILKASADVIRAPVEMLPRLLDLRMQAFEDRAAALGLVEETVASSTRGEHWKESAAELKELVSGPLGRAAVGRLMGMEGDDLKNFVGLDAEETAANDKGDIRSMLLKLAGTFTEAQKSALRTKVGPQRVELLITAATAPDERSAAGCVAKFFAEVEKANLFGTLQAELDDAQQAIVVRVMDALEEHTDDKI